MRWRGLTLLELLVVIAIMSGATVVMLGVTQPIAQSQSALAVKAATESAISRVRLMAQSTGRAVLTAETGGLVTKSEDRSMRASLPRGWDVRLRSLSVNRSLESITFDSAGRSIDFAVNLTADNGAEFAFEILGLSGQIIEQGGPQ